MLKVGINGFGRIGRAIFRVNMDKSIFEIVAINDINHDVENLAYQLNYDTLYGQLKDKFKAKNNHIFNDKLDMTVFNERHIDDVDWKSEDVDIVIDASGLLDNVLRGHATIQKQNVKKVIVTHSPDEVDFTMVLGANEGELDLSVHHLISSSICDATAIAPVLKIIKDNFGIISGHITTLHPWLGYQNLMDGPASSYSVPGNIYHHFALGRSAAANMIPKPTTALSACCKVLDGISPELIGSYSIRTPTQIVACADLTLTLKENTTHDEIIKVFEDYSNTQRWNIINNSIEPLVSLDFQSSEFSANIDHRFTSLVQGNMLKIVLWYDNEWGYSTKVCEQIEYIKHLGLHD